jgi:hypothetical protein
MRTTAAAEGETTGSDTEEPMVECEDGLTWCDGECRALSYDERHCGECYHECEPRAGSGNCVLGYCTPVAGPCLNVDDGLQTCGEYCTSIDEQCAEALDITGNQCYGEILLGSTPTCGSKTAYLVDPTQICDWPIPFGGSVYDGLFPVNGVICCCTQENGG